MNFNLSGITQVATRVAGKAGLIIGKYGPDFMIGFGITGLIGATAIALSDNTKTKATFVVDTYRDNMDVIHEARDTRPAQYSEEDMATDTAVILVRTTRDIAKVYGPAIILGGISIGAILWSHDILTKRNVGLLAAYKAIDEGFKAYRGRVIDEFGEAKDYEFRHGVKVKEVAVVDPETGKETGEKKVVIENKNNFQPSIYAKWFSDGEDGKEKSYQWRKDAISNEFFLKAQQNYANDKLRSQGHLFLNEVYDSLGLKRTPEGAIVGWIAGSDGDGKVDFGLYDPINEGAFDVVEGHNRAIHLDFNVDGSIWDKI